MKEFFKDYGELCKETGRFYKKHWLGTIVLNGVCIVVGLAPIIIEGYKETKELENMLKENEE